MKAIAKVRLVRGNVAFFDTRTKIHLTISNPTATIYEDMDVTRIRRAVKNGVLSLVYGTLVPQSESEAAEQARQEAVSAQESANPPAADVKPEQPAEVTEIPHTPENPMVFSDEVKYEEGTGEGIREGVELPADGVERMVVLGETEELSTAEEEPGEVAEEKKGRKKKK